MTKTKIITTQGPLPLANKMDSLVNHLERSDGYS